MAGVSLVNVKKTYPGGVTAVHESSLETADQEFMVLVGPSGCGKTTTLRMIAGLEEVTSGTVSIGGRVVNDVLPKDRDIAMVFQNYAIYPHMTVYDNMAFGLRQRKTPKAEIDRRVRETAELLHIEGLLGRRPKALSGGQRQRVALGRAIVREPKVFLFDEPLSNLDAKMRMEMRKELKLLHQRLKTTMIYVTHDQVEAMTLGDRVCVMNTGRIEQVGSPLEVYDRPATRFVAGFIGTPPMNFLPGRLRRANGRPVFGGAGFACGIPEGTPMEDDALGVPVEFGVRPEDLLHDDRAAPNGFIPGVVKLVESLGNEQLIYVECGGTMLISRRDAHVRVAPGDAQRLVPRPGKLHFFRSDDGRRVGGPQGAPVPA
jgi:multiple sugar transport system ATP-binding protein